MTGDNKRPFRLHAEYEAAGDQPNAISKLTAGLHDGLAHQTLLGVTGSGKSIGYDDEIYLLAHCGGRLQPSVVKAGPYLDRLLSECLPRGTSDVDTECYWPSDRAFSTYSYDPRSGWAGITRVAAFLRHRAPQRMFELRTQCGRAVTLTPDHNLWVLRDGMPALIRTEEARSTDFLPVPDRLPATGELREIEVLDHLGDAGLKAFADPDANLPKRAANCGRTGFVSGMHGDDLQEKQFAMRCASDDGGVPVEHYLNSGIRSAYRAAVWRVGDSLDTHRLPARLALCDDVMRQFGYYIGADNVGGRGCSTYRLRDYVA